MSYRDWHVGMKVVCIAPIQNRTAYGDELIPAVGHVYTIRLMGVCGWSGTVTIYLSELVNPEREYDLPNGSQIQGEPGFAAKHFRPVQPRKTDISIFTAMLTGKKQKVPA